MTAQIADKVLYAGDEYSLIGIDGTGLPVPQDYGMSPTMIHTACYRGFYVTYSISKDQLILMNMTLREIDGEYLQVNGIDASIDDYGRGVYKKIHQIVQFTGKLRIARDFIDSMYVHMGFQKPASFQTVLDLKFIKGKLIDVMDLSKIMAAKRKENKGIPLQINSIDDIKDAFNLDIDD